MRWWPPVLGLSVLAAVQPSLATVNPLSAARIAQAQHPLDHFVDALLGPLWHLAEPFANLVTFLLYTPVRLHFRLEEVRTLDDTGSFLAASRSLQQALGATCSSLTSILKMGDHDFLCPKGLLIRGTRPRAAVLPLGPGQAWLLIATEGLVTQLQPAELRFVLGRELGRYLLHHGAVPPLWTLTRFAADALALPIYAFGALFRALRGEAEKAHLESAGRSFSSTDAAGSKLREVADSLGLLCELYLGLRAGRWPGGRDAEVEMLVAAAASMCTSTPVAQPLVLAQPASPEVRLLDATATLLAKLRSPGGAMAIAASSLSLCGPRLVAEALGLESEEERQLRLSMHLLAWAASLWTGKVRAEVYSADRIGLLANGGNEEAALAAMIKTAPHRSDSAMVALIGSDQLVRQAELLARVLPRQPFDLEPSLPARIVEMNSWARSPGGRALLASGGGL